MSVIQLNILNIGLIFVSLAIAFILPFHLFLFAYAILGPLHYMTEINWLKKQNYFVERQNWVWIPCLFVLLVLLPKLIVFPNFSWLRGDHLLGSIISLLSQYNNGLIFLWLAISVALVYTKKWSAFIVIVGLGLASAIFLNPLNSYSTIVGLLIPTVIHVYIFTLLFMLYGALKKRSSTGYLSVLLLALCPFVIALAQLDSSGYLLSEEIKQTFIDGKFYITNAKFAKFMGLNDGTQYSFEALLDIKVQIFIAFAYTYHYLNWFSKTTVIKWHKGMSVWKTVTIMLLWILSIILYWYNYAAAIIVLLSVSMLHVFLEFPLNIISIRGIAQELRQILSPR